MSESFEAWTTQAQLLYLKDGYDALVARDDLTDRRIKRGERQRVRMFIFGVCVLIISVVAILLDFYVLVSRGNARNYYNQQQHMLACALVQFTPPGDQLGDALRSQYECPAYRSTGRR